jgi:hypothetical protein
MWHFVIVSSWGSGRGSVGYSIVGFVGFMAGAAIVVATILAMFWRMYGRETIEVDAARLRVGRVFGPVRVYHVFNTSAVSNVRWRERLVARKHGGYQRRLVSFDVDGKTVEVGTYLTLSEATELERELRTAISVWRGDVLT